MAEPAGEPFTFGSYRIREEIGRGGMGVVYRAVQEELDRPVALKMILASHLGSPERVARFHAEAKVAARTRHPNLVGVIDSGEVHGQHYIAMEFVAGRSLEQTLADGPLPAREAMRIMCSVARAVEHLHSLGVQHRDIKPSNILVDESGTAFLTDFGLAKDASGRDGVTSASGAVAGTPAYMAPELLSPRFGRPGPVSDVFGLAAVLYELCAGRPPFGSDDTTDVVLRIIEDEPASLRELAPSLPADLQTVIMRGLEKRTGERYPSAAALADDLERLLAGAPIETAGAGVGRRLQRWVRRHTALAARLATFVAFYPITLATWWSGRVDLTFAVGITVVLAVWAVASILIDARLQRSAMPHAWRLRWLLVDAVAITALLLVADGAASSIVVVYFLLIASTGLWTSLALLRFALVCCLGSYGLVVLDSVLLRTEHGRSPDQHFMTAIAMVMLAGIVDLQIRRTRTLRRFLAQRRR